MKVIALNGSARGRKGVTWRLMDSLLKGLSEGGAIVKDIQLKEMNISFCRACLTCMHKTPGQCAQQDDMDQIYPHLKESELFVMGTPVYTDSMSAQMKTVMDRCICGMDPFLRLDPANRMRHPYHWAEAPPPLGHAFKILPGLNIGISGDGDFSAPGYDVQGPGSELWLRTHRGNLHPRLNCPANGAATSRTLP